MANSLISADFRQDVETFNLQAASLGFPDVANYYWYHTVELPNGLVTPGLYDFRATLPQFQFPDRMIGTRVLDVGSATGFFAFEFAKRGSDVTSVELPSLYSLDRFPGQDIEQTLEKIGQMIVPKSVESLRGYVNRYSADQLYNYLLEGPFEFCRSLLNLPIARCYSTVYDLTVEKTGGEFDLVFMGDILLHTINPLQALSAVAPLCRGTLILAQVIPGRPEDPPAMQYVGGDSLHSDEVSWWLPNLSCLTSLLKKLGFATVTEIGRHGGVLRPSGYEFERSILRAEKA
jgi:tRNA (mo5U34)-methyltransferase